MKKYLGIFAVIMIFTALAFSPIFDTQVKAQALTSSEIQMIRPQLNNLLIAMRSALVSVQTEITVQNNLLGTYSRVLGQFSARLSGSSTPTQAELDSMSRILSEIQKGITFVADRRTDIMNTLSNASQILSNIASMLGIQISNTTTTTSTSGSSSGY